LTNNKPMKMNIWGRYNQRWRKRKSKCN